MHPWQCMQAVRALLFPRLDIVNQSIQHAVHSAAVHAMRCCCDAGCMPTPAAGPQLLQANRLTHKWSSVASAHPWSMTSKHAACCHSSYCCLPSSGLHHLVPPPPCLLLLSPKLPRAPTARLLLCPPHEGAVSRVHVILPAVASSLACSPATHSASGPAHTHLLMSTLYDTYFGFSGESGLQRYI